MSRSSRLIGWSVLPSLLILTSLGPGPQNPVPDLPAIVKPPPPVKGLSPAEAVAAIKPLPLEAIPHDPPPHEGNVFELSYRLAPPDLLIVEILEALPGRPITGERLIRPDGTVSLGFYGDVHVAGLTVTQAKAKITHHLRMYLTDEALGLVMFKVPGGVPPLPPPGTKVEGMVPLGEADAPPVKVDDHKAPLDLDINFKLKRPFELDIRVQEPIHEEKMKRSLERQQRALREIKALEEEIRALKGEPKPPAEALPKAEDPRKPGLKPLIMPDDAKVAPPPDKGPEAIEEGKTVAVDPVDSDRVFVDVSAYNSKIYYVLGAVGSPGRLPITGRETVLDALQFAAGMQSDADPRAVVLHRPARGDAPRRQFVIDLPALYRGDVKANLQLFPGDRLIVGVRSNTINMGGAPVK